LQEDKNPIEKMTIKKMRTVNFMVFVLEIARDFTAN
jgi:hypothetical protein